MLKHRRAQPVVAEQWRKQDFSIAAMGGA